MAKKKSHTQSVLDAIQGKFGASGRFSAGPRSQVTEVLPLGIGVLDHYVLGCGGLPVGRLVELYGDEGAGKTSLMYRALACAQLAGGLAMLVETEDSLDPDRAKVFGVDPFEVVLAEPDTMEAVLNAMRGMLHAIPAGVGPNVLAWDSLASATLEAQIAKEIGAHVPGKRGKLLSEGIPQITNLAAKKRTTILLVNQIRDKIGVMFGNPTTTPGGHAPKFAASIRVQLWGGKAFLDSGSLPNGNRVLAKNTKNKTALPGRKAVLRLDYATGWDDDWSTLELAKTQKLIGARSRGAKALLEARAQLGFPVPGVEG